MSTPAVITLRNAYDKDHAEVAEVVHIFRGSDGYPSVGGKDIADAILAASRRPPRKRSYGSYEFTSSAGWIQRVLAELCTCYGRLEFLDKDHLLSSSLEYVVTADYSDYGGEGYLDESEFLDRISIECRYKGIVFFTGDVETFAAWCPKATAPKW